MAVPPASLAASIRSHGQLWIILADEDVDSLSSEDILALQAEFATDHLMTLPPRELRFFAWLREQDPPVWDELFPDGEVLPVSFAFLPLLQKGGNGFPICELEHQPNHFFTSRHIKPAGLAAADGILERIEHGGTLTVAEALFFEILRAPIDIWHFCHRHHIPLQQGRDAVDDLAARDWIVHLTHADDIAPYTSDLFQPSQP